MLYFFAWVCPPLAVLFCGRPFSAMANCFLTLFGWMPGVRHARQMVDLYYADRRNTRLVKAIRSPHDVYMPQLDRMMGMPPPSQSQQVVYIAPQPQAALPPARCTDPTVGERGTVFRKRGRQ